jgi:hypothetical protein
VYKRVDTCAAEFSTSTAYMYSTYDEECEANPTDRDKIMILGGGPNRIGQGIEFDYCCVHAALALREDGYETIMVNCNPETVSTDYDTSDRLYFESLTLEDVLEIVALEKPKGVIVHLKLPVCQLLVLRRMPLTMQKIANGSSKWSKNSACCNRQIVWHIQLIPLCHWRQKSVIH